MEILKYFFHKEVLYRYISFLLFLLSYNINAQNKIITDKIYNSIDAFIANPKPENLIVLENLANSFKESKKPKTSDELLAIVVLYCNKAFYEKQFGLNKNAIKSYENAWQIFASNKLQNYDIIQYCLQPLGNLYTVFGDYDNAENTIKQYYNIAFINRKIKVTHSAILNLSIVYQQSGRINTAIDLLKNMLDSNQLNVSERALYQSNLASNYLLLQQNENAEKSILVAIKEFQKQKNKTLELSNCYKNLSTIYFQKKDYQLASVYFETALRYESETFGLGQYHEAKLFYEYAVLLHKMNDDYKSKEYLNLALNNLINGFVNQNTDLPNQKQLYADNVLLDVLEFKAEIFTQENNLKKALEAYQLCDYIDDLFSNLLVYENSKIYNQIRVRKRAEKVIAIYDKLYKIEHKQIYIEKAFCISEKSKAGVLKNQLYTNNTSNKEQNNLRNQIQSVNNEIVKEQQKVNLADLDKINILLAKQNRLMLSLKFKQQTNIKSNEKPIYVNLLLSKLDHEKAWMIEYFYGENIVYEFVLNDHKISINSFDNTLKNRAIFTRFIEFFASPDAITNDISNYISTGNETFNLLNIPLNIKNKNLIIVPDGLLNFIPFEALITKKSSTTNFAKMNYLLNNFVIANNISAGSYLNSRALKNKNTVLGIFPIFEKTDFELSFSVPEMQAIKNNFSGQFFSKSGATFKNFRENANKFSILHLSTHSDSGDLESPATIKFYDQDILYSEFYNLKINPDLVVLSACQTGIGKLYKSEGAMSIARGFQMAGAQNLLFSLWKVNDYTTSVIMANFYKNLKNNCSFANANHNSKIDFLKDKNILNNKKSPYYWSAFVYYGTLEEPNSNYYIWIIAIIALIVFGLILARKILFKK